MITPPLIPSSDSRAAEQAEPRHIRVGHCIHGLGLGGAQQVIRHLATASDTSRYSHFVYAANDGVFHKDVKNACAAVRLVPRVMPKLDPFWIARLVAWMRRDEIDVVHTHLFGDNLHGFLAARLAGRLPVVMTLHNSTLDFTSIQLLGYRELLPRCVRVVACSPSVASSFREKFGTRAAAMEVVMNGLDLPASSAGPDEAARLRAELQIPANAPLIVAAGRMVPQKDFASLIDAMSLLRRSSDARLLLLGDGPLRAALEQQAHDLGVGDRVVFTGFRGDARRVIGSADLMAFSSHYEGLPVTLLEAMAASRCVVATDVPGLSDVLEDGKNALLVPQGDAPRMADALLRALREPQLREKLARVAHLHYTRDLTAAPMARAYERIYAEVCSPAGDRLPVPNAEAHRTSAFNTAATAARVSRRAYQGDERGAAARPGA